MDFLVVEDYKIHMMSGRDGTKTWGERKSCVNELGRSGRRKGAGERTVKRIVHNTMELKVSII